MAAAKRRSHPTVEPAHVAAGCLKVDEDATRAALGELADRLPALLGKDGRHLGAPAVSEAVTALLAGATDLDSLLAALGPALAAAPVAADGPSQSAVRAEVEVAEAAEVEATPATRRTVEELLAELDDLVGLAPVKAQVRELCELQRINAVRRERGMPVLEQKVHLVFTGNPGTGKTTVARLVGQLYGALGIVRSGHLVETSRVDLVAGYVGQTALKTKQVVDKAAGGVLFVDEAYALARNDRGDDFGSEAIETLLKLMEDKRDDFVVIAAGYPRPMQDFLTSNPGLRSRFGRVLEFPDYDVDELLTIFDGMCADLGYRADPELRAGVRDALGRFRRDETFGNARLVRNLVEDLIGRHAVRLAGDDDLDDDELALLLPVDLEGLVPESPDAGNSPGLYL